MEGVPDPNAKASVILRENLRYIIVGDKLSLVELCEYPFSKGLLDWFEVYLHWFSYTSRVLPVT